jgi:hypothetical protein
MSHKLEMLFPFKLIRIKITLYLNQIPPSLHKTLDTLPPCNWMLPLPEYKASLARMTNSKVSVRQKSGIPQEVGLLPFRPFLDHHKFLQLLFVTVQRHDILDDCIPRLGGKTL